MLSVTFLLSINVA